MSSRILVYAVIGLLICAGRTDAEEQAADQPHLYDMGRKAFAGCAACHFVTDPQISQDADWLKLNQITACISAGVLTDQTRQAINAFLADPRTLRPPRVDENYKPPEGLACGRLKVPPTAGSAFLRAERESIRTGTPPKVRLAWQASAQGRMLKVPAGQYQVIGYRFYRTDPGPDQNACRTWTLSVTDANGCSDLAIAPDAEAVFPFEPVIQTRLSCDLAAPDGIKLRLAVRNESDSVLTLSRDGSMCLPQFAIIENATGKELYRGAFENS